MDGKEAESKRKKKKKSVEKKAKRAAKKAAKAATRDDDGPPEQESTQERCRSKRRPLRDRTADSILAGKKRLRTDHPQADEPVAAKQPKQLTVMQIIAQPPDTVDMAELQRLRSLPSVANTATSEEDEEDEADSQRGHSVEIKTVVALTVPLVAEPAQGTQTSASTSAAVAVTPAASAAAVAAAAAAAAAGATARRGDGTPPDAARTAARVAKRKRKGERQLASGEYSAAIATFEAALALAPGDRDLLQNKLNAEKKLQKPKKDRSEEKKQRRREQKAAKRAKLQAHLAEKGGRNAVVTPSVASEHPFEVTDEKDHAETPFDAYRDIEPFLFQLALRRKKSKATIRLYDPYYCEGSVVHHMNRLGFESVYNRNEDFYAAISEKKTPEYDVLLTNPPYSGDHWDRLLEFGCYSADAGSIEGGSGTGRPLLALMPDFIAERSGFKQRAVTARKRWVFLGPKDKAYRFAAPTLAADGESALLSTKKDGSAFVPSKSDYQTFTCNSFQCVWYMQLGTEAETEAIVKWWKKKYAKQAPCVIANDVRELPQLLEVEAERRERKYLRKKAKMQQEDENRASCAPSTQAKAP